MSNRRVLSKLMSMIRLGTEIGCSFSRAMAFAAYSCSALASWITEPFPLASGRVIALFLYWYTDSLAELALMSALEIPIAADFVQNDPLLPADSIHRRMLFLHDVPPSTAPSPHTLQEVALLDFFSPALPHSPR